MEDTILIGVLVRVVPRGTPQREDLIVFQYPVDHSQTFMKRVIGLPGDRIRLVNKVVYRNGVALQEPYASHKESYPDSYRDNFPTGEATASLFPAAEAMLKDNETNREVVVPKDSYFVSAITATTRSIAAIGDS